MCHKITERLPAMNNDPVNPTHYTLPCGHETIDITRHMSFTLGNVIKYVIRAGRKNGIEDLKKAKRYIEWAIEDSERETKTLNTP